MIVVGFDGSEPALAALRWAAEEAALRDTDLHVLRAWNLVDELAAALGGRGTTGPVPPVTELEANAQRRLEDEVAAVLPAEHMSRARCRAVREHPVTSLVAASADAELVVVGPRGHGRVVGMVLGSVSLAVVHQARCPVVVVQA